MVSPVPSSSWILALKAPPIDTRTTRSNTSPSSMNAGQSARRRDSGEVERRSRRPGTRGPGRSPGRAHRRGRDPEATSATAACSDARVAQAEPRHERDGAERHRHREREAGERMALGGDQPRLARAGDDDARSSDRQHDRLAPSSAAPATASAVDSPAASAIARRRRACNDWSAPRSAIATCAAARRPRRARRATSDPERGLAHATASCEPAGEAQHADERRPHRGRAGTRRIRIFACVVSIDGQAATHEHRQ